MDRVISDEERIRRAEEIISRRRNRIPADTFNNINEGRHKISKFGKFFIQTISSICIFGIMYFINQNYSFAMDKIKPVMDNDTDFNQIYRYVNNVFYDIVEDNNEVKENNSDENDTNENTTNEQENTSNENEELKNTTSQIDNNNENNLIVESQSNNNSVEVSQSSDNNDEKLDDVSYIKKYANIIKPVNGTVTSGYGERTPTDIISAYHKGVDIGASTGTPIYSCMDGEVTEVLDYGDYGKHLKIVNGEISILYAHCSKIDVNKGDKVSQGQKIAEVGSTRKVYRSTFTYRNIAKQQKCRSITNNSILVY